MVGTHTLHTAKHGTRQKIPRGATALFLFSATLTSGSTYVSAQETPPDGPIKPPRMLSTPRPAEAGLPNDWQSFRIEKPMAERGKDDAESSALSGSGAKAAAFL